MMKPNPSPARRPPNTAAGGAASTADRARDSKSKPAALTRPTVSAAAANNKRVSGAAAVAAAAKAAAKSDDEESENESGSAESGGDESESEDGDSGSGSGSSTAPAAAARTTTTNTSAGSAKTPIKSGASTGGGGGSGGVARGSGAAAAAAKRRAPPPPDSDGSTDDSTDETAPNANASTNAARPVLDEETKAKNAAERYRKAVLQWKDRGRVGGTQYQTKIKAASAAARASGGTIRFRSFLHNTIHDVFKGRGYKETDSETEWEIFWCDKPWIRLVYDKVHLDAAQKVNHFRNFYEITRKDLLIKNLQRTKRALQKKGRHEEAAQYDFAPVTYSLPTEYLLFVEAFKKQPDTKWIAKPIARSQGKGIFLFDKLSQISDWKNDTRWNPNSGGGGGGGGAGASAPPPPPPQPATKPSASAAGGGGGGGSDDEAASDDDAPAANVGLQTEKYIVQRYIHNPLLVGGKKFDLRLYALVTSYQPVLNVYLYREGFARFSSARFTMDKGDVENSYVHITNVAIQKKSTSYDAESGGKWDVRGLKLYLISKFGHERVNQLFCEIQLVIIRSLLAVQKVMISDKHSFEMYGYDLLLDADLKVWLLEVNACPSLTANTLADYKLKYDLLHDMLTIVDMEKRLNGTEDQVGGFDLIYRNGFVKFDAHCTQTTYLGAHNNRVPQLAKMWKAKYPQPTTAAAAASHASTAGSGGSGGGASNTGGGDESSPAKAKSGAGAKSKAPAFG